MKQCVVTVEVMTAEWGLVQVFQKSLQHDIAKGKIGAAAMDPRAIAELDAVNPWDLAITVWNDVEDEDRYLAVYFPASTACQAIAKHFQIDAGLLRRATTPAEVHRLCSEQERHYAKAMQPLGLHKNSKLSVIDREFFVREGQH
ncbi:hypothetical protein [Caballeronia sp. dw_276]|uniref:hypothetical protein n=1 Tax=Caballeronia sp. dw_276 TaxID=2719795 RepID=UPI001BD1F14D|nr:hypothetical protein [Caballeronia sp. dw_276]